VATVIGNKHRSQHYCYIRNGLEEAVAIAMLLEVTRQVPMQVIPEGRGSDPADLVSSDDGEPPSRSTGIYQDRPLAIPFGELPRAEQLVGTGLRVGRRPLVNNQADGRLRVPARRGQPGVNLLTLAWREEWGPAKRTQQAHGGVRPARAPRRLWRLACSPRDGRPASR